MRARCIERGAAPGRTRGALDVRAHRERRRRGCAEMKNTLLLGERTFWEVWDDDHSCRLHARLETCHRQVGAARAPGRIGEDRFAVVSGADAPLVLTLVLHRSKYASGRRRRRLSLSHRGQVLTRAKEGVIAIPFSLNSLILCPAGNEGFPGDGFERLRIPLSFARARQPDRAETSMRNVRVLAAARSISAT